jgi:hypothetical protein
MKILAFVHDRYGIRIVENIRARAPAYWHIDQLAAPRILPPIVDDPLDFIPSELPSSDLILHLAETAQAAQLLPGVVKLSGARVVIAPVDNEAWLPSGLRLQLIRELSLFGAEIHFPQPFCSLDTSQSGVGDIGNEPKPILTEFTQHFGRPSLQLKLSEDQETIREVVVERGAPCGSSQYAANRIAGMKVSEVVPQGGLICLHYPCLASMQPKTTEHGVETLMHTSGIIYNQSLRQAIERIDEVDHG